MRVGELNFWLLYNNGGCYVTMEVGIVRVGELNIWLLYSLETKNSQLFIRLLYMYGSLLISNCLLIKFFCVWINKASENNLFSLLFSISNILML